ncbi:hypothetical protein [Antarctobacter sp.]|uniref:hypothetical protein n=1 Tax=Antarctobacter sp. TaxID=1872577 RepID=UPI003A8CD632
MRIFRANDVQAVHINNNPDFIHRRLVSPMTEGPEGVDVGLNTYKGGHRFNGPYAYNTDEFCYISEGVAEGESHGVPFRASPGIFLFREAGAQTDFFDVPQSIVNICAFAPGRFDMDSHRLAPEDYGDWDGSPGPKKLPVLIHYQDVSPTRFELAGDQAGLTYRKVFHAGNGSLHCEVGHLIISANTITDITPPATDEVWWIEKGRLSVTETGKTESAAAHECIHLAAGGPARRIEALAPVTLIRLATRTG